MMATQSFARSARPGSISHVITGQVAGHQSRMSMNASTVNRDPSTLMLLGEDKKSREYCETCPLPQSAKLSEYLQRCPRNVRRTRLRPTVSELAVHKTEAQAAPEINPRLQNDPRRITSHRRRLRPPKMGSSHENELARPSRERAQ